MKKLLFALLGLLFSAPFWGQEIVVFKDYRSLAVQSHRVQGDWTYLRVGGGELAILSKGILEIRQEGTEARTASEPLPAPAPAHPMVQRPSTPPQVSSSVPTPPPMPFRPPPGAVNPTPSLNANEGDENASDADDDNDDEEAPKPMPPPSPMRPPPTNSGAIVRPVPLAPAQGIVPNK